MSALSTQGRYESRDVARMARNRFTDLADTPDYDPGGYFYCCRYMPCERYRETPWAVLAFKHQDEADEITEQGEIV